MAEDVPAAIGQDPATAARLILYSRAIRDLGEGLRSITAHLEFVNRESRDLDIPEQASTAIAECCAEFHGLIGDVRKQILKLEDQLGLRPGQAPHDPDDKKPDPRQTMRFITTWLTDGIDGLLALATELEQPQSGGMIDTVGALVLLHECTANIDNAQSAILDRIDAIEGQLPPQGEGAGQSIA